MLTLLTLTWSRLRTLTVLAGLHQRAHRTRAGLLAAFWHAFLFGVMAEEELGGPTAGACLLRQRWLALERLFDSCVHSLKPSLCNNVNVPTAGSWQRSQRALRFQLVSVLSWVEA